MLSDRKFADGVGQVVEGQRKQERKERTPFCFGLNTWTTPRGNSWNLTMDGGKRKAREKHGDADSVRETECERDADKGSMHCGQIFTCWVTFCIKLMYNWWKAFIPMSIGTLDWNEWRHLFQMMTNSTKGSQIVCQKWQRLAQKHVFPLSLLQISSQNGSLGWECLFKTSFSVDTSAPLMLNIFLVGEKHCI